MMLANALMKMIAKTECFIFFNTENSTYNVQNEINSAHKQMTYSPWIYLEINSANLIKQTIPNRKVWINQNKDMNYFLENTNYLLGKYALDLQTFNEINIQKVSQWLTSYKTSNKKIHPLNFLYALYQMPNIDEVAIDK